MPPISTPRLAVWLLRRVLPPGSAGQAMLGDLIEEAARSPLPRCEIRRRFWRSTLSLTRRYLFARDPTAPTFTLPERSSLMSAMLHDVKHAVRGLRSAPALTAAILATLALAIGAATAIFSIVDAVLIRPLPFIEPDRLVAASSLTPDGNRMAISWPDFLDLRARARSFSDIAASQRTTFTFAGRSGADRLDGRQVSWNFLRVLGGRPALGRDFGPEDDKPSGAHAVMISDSFWRGALGGSSSVINREILLDNKPHVIVGVLPAGFKYSQDVPIWEPIGVLTDDPHFLDRGDHWAVSMVSRLRPGVAVGAAREELTAIVQQLDKEYPNTDSGNGVIVQPLSELLMGDVKPTLVALLGAVGFLLLLACVNIANLLVARGAARRHELAIRAALGGTRARLVSQLLAESGVLAIAGGILGVATGWGLLHVLLSIAPADTPRLDEASMSAPVLGFAAAASALAGVIFGVLPALYASRISGQQALIRASRSGGVASHRLRRGLMVVELAFALILLVGAGLMMQTMRRLAIVDAGFNPQHLITARIAMPDEWPAPRVLAVQHDLLDHLRAAPNVVDAALTGSLPISGSQWGSVFTLNDRPVPPRANLPSAAFSPVTAGYFRAMGIRLDHGRQFADSDAVDQPAVAIVNETFARHFWPDGHALGNRIKQGWPEWKTPWVEIVGIAADVKLDGVAADTPPQIYLPMTQSLSRDAYMAVRTTGGGGPDAAALRAILRTVAPDVPMYQQYTMDQLLTTSSSMQRTSTVVLTVFAALALVLAAVGLYGVVSQGITERTHEIGIRMALGADRGRVMRLFVGQGAITAITGTALGLAGAFGLSRFLHDLIFGVTTTDPATFGVVAITLLSVAMAACYVPARRATRVSPTVALRGD